MAYNPGVMASIDSFDELKDYLEGELLAIAQELRDRSDINVAAFNVLAREPDKPRDGMLAYADGVNFAPSIQKGFYERVGGLWKKL